MLPGSQGIMGCFQDFKYLDAGGGEENIMGMASWSFTFCIIFRLKDTPLAPQSFWYFTHPTNISSVPYCTSGNVTQDAERLNGLPEVFQKLQSKLGSKTRGLNFMSSVLLVALGVCKIEVQRGQASFPKAYSKPRAEPKSLEKLGLGWPAQSLHPQGPLHLCSLSSGMQKRWPSGLRLRMSLWC